MPFHFQIPSLPATAGCAVKSTCKCVTGWKGRAPTQLAAALAAPDRQHQASDARTRCSKSLHYL